MNLTTTIKDKTIIKASAQAYTIFRKIAGKPQEYFVVLTLSGSHAPIKFHIVTIGLLNRAAVHPREVFRPAIRDNAAAVIVGHNHPSGELEPSPEDKEVTERLREASEIIGINFLDHLIVSEKGFYSFNENKEV
jgi:DNA repair protein RadC